jgi:hypothetical protein
MKTPDKIYLVKDAANPEDIFDTVASKKPMFQDDVCYIRKDALIEILQGYSHPLAKLVMQEIIEKINSL